MSKSGIVLEEIDRTRIENCQEVVDLIKTHYPNSRNVPTAERVKNSTVRYFKAFHDKKWFGITGFRQDYPTLVETVKTIVFKEFRGSGLGKKLSQEIEDYCCDMGVHKIMTSIYSYNHTMISIKLKQGYIIEGFHPHHEEMGIHEYTLGKLLKKP